MSFWTEERVERLKGLLSDGLSYAQITKVLGASSRDAVCGKCHRLGLYRTPEQVRAATLNGIRARRGGRLLGAPPVRVHGADVLPPERLARLRRVAAWDSAARSALALYEAQVAQTPLAGVA